MNAVEDWLAAVEARDLTICGSCDGGLPMACTCGDPRASLALTVAALRAVLALHSDAGRSQGFTAVGYGYIKHCCAVCGSFGEYGEPWPCATVRAITAALGVTL